MVREQMPDKASQNLAGQESLIKFWHGCGLFVDRREWHNFQIGSRT